ncbi:hypothetical protein SDC9_82359 [bioreactor metagenome]|uniref:Xylose isomerase-like TIM barrel domain-containing protein n=1 Tax=bioreactor metagenome TaxID=1076179 RepID=A0A644Z4D2_9ZZZZ
MNVINDLYISTISEDAQELAAQHGLGLEIAEYCTAWNMDKNFPHCDTIVRRKLQSAKKTIFHAPFNELCPAAIDPMVVDVTRRRYEQSLSLSLRYGIKKLVIHSGFIPLIYYNSWFTEHSVEFWHDFLADKPTDLIIYLENVMESSPDMLVEIVKGVDDPRFRLCLDVGHANTCVSKTPISKWVETAAPYLGHVHLHNNAGSLDTHDGLDCGTLPMAKVINHILMLCPSVSFTVETVKASCSIRWLYDNGFLR